jgi:hypothetical protein
VGTIIIVVGLHWAIHFTARLLATLGFASVQQQSS